MSNQSDGGIAEKQDQGQTSPASRGFRRPEMSRSITPRTPRKTVTPRSPGDGDPNKPKIVSRIPMLIPTSPGSQKPAESNTLEAQFRNKKRLFMQYYVELSNKQAPVMELYQSLQTLQKQLAEAGKKVDLEELTTMTLEQGRSVRKGAGENAAIEGRIDGSILTIKSSIDSVLHSCRQLCEKCFSKRDHIIQVLENVCLYIRDPSDVEQEIDALKEDQDALEKALESSVRENEKIIKEIVAKWETSEKVDNLSVELDAKIVELQDTVNRQQKMIEDITKSRNELIDKEIKANDMVRKQKKIIEEYEENNNNNKAVIRTRIETITKLERDLTKSKKSFTDKSRENVFLKNKLKELESSMREFESSKYESSLEIRELQGKLREMELELLHEKDASKNRETLLRDQLVEQEKLMAQNNFKETIKELEMQIMDQEDAFRKREATLQRKLEDQETLHETRIKAIEEKALGSIEAQREEIWRCCEDQLESKEQAITTLKKEKAVLTDRNMKLEDELSVTKHILNNREKEVVSCEEQMSNMEHALDKKREELKALQHSLKYYNNLKFAFQIEKGQLMNLCSTLRDQLSEARADVKLKSKQILQISGELQCQKQTAQGIHNKLKEFELTKETSSGDKPKPRERSTLAPIHRFNAELIKISKLSTPLVGMSERKLDELRGHLDSLQHLKLKAVPEESDPDCPGPSNSAMSATSVSRSRRNRKIMVELNKILKHHANESCDEVASFLRKKAQDQLTKSRRHHPFSHRSEYRHATRDKKSPVRLSKSDSDTDIDT